MKKIYQKCGLIFMLGLSSAFSTDNLFIDEHNNATQRHGSCVSDQGDILLELEKLRKEAISSGKFKSQEPLPSYNYRTIEKPISVNLKISEGGIGMMTSITCTTRWIPKGGLLEPEFSVIRSINN